MYCITQEHHYHTDPSAENYLRILILSPKKLPTASDLNIPATPMSSRNNYEVVNQDEEGGPRDIDEGKDSQTTDISTKDHKGERAQ